jgi:hypothetical protein
LLLLPETNKTKKDHLRIITFFSYRSYEFKFFTIRFNTQYRETIEMKRVYRHPLYEYGRGYNNIALIELGRRIVFNYDKFGDMPTCLDTGIDRVIIILTMRSLGIY